MFDYQNIKNEFNTNFDNGIFIDDTGSPGATNQGNLNPQRKSWVAVIVPSHQICEVLEQSEDIIDELNKLLGTKEVHFKDIWGGTNEYKNIDLQVRLNLFRFMAKIFQDYQFPIFVQTFSPEQVKKLRLNLKLTSLQQKRRIGFRQHDFFDYSDVFSKRKYGFNFQDNNDLALFFLLIRIRLFMKKDGFSNVGLNKVFIDEGFKKHDNEIIIPEWKDIFRDGKLKFVASDKFVPIQLADFAAFCLNRSQIIINKSEISELDKTFLKIADNIQNNYKNLYKITLKL